MNGRQKVSNTRKTESRFICIFPFYSIPFRSIPFYLFYLFYLSILSSYLPIYSIPFHSIPFHSILSILSILSIYPIFLSSYLFHSILFYLFIYPIFLSSYLWDSRTFHLCRAVGYLNLAVKFPDSTSILFYIKDSLPNGKAGIKETAHTPQMVWDDMLSQLHGDGKT